MKIGYTYWQDKKKTCEHKPAALERETMELQLRKIAASAWGVLQRNGRNAGEYPGSRPL